jgi:hypothetical protein
MFRATVSHHGRKISEENFATYAQGVLDGLKQAVTAAASDSATVREEERNAIQVPIVLVPQSGPMRSLPVPCTAVNYSADGLAALSMVPLDPGDVRVRLPGRADLLKARVVRCQPDSLERHFMLGIRLPDGIQLTLDMLTDPKKGR